MTFVDGLVECEFIEELAHALNLSDADRPGSTPWARFGNTIGALALRLKLMSHRQVDDVLETQETEGGFFGETAIRKQYLTGEQVSRLLELQDLHDRLSLAEQLVVSGKLSVVELIDRLANFLKQHADRA